MEAALSRSDLTSSSDAAVHLGLQHAGKALESRLEELSASQPQEAQRWFGQHLELYCQHQLDGKTEEEEQLVEVLRQHLDRIRKKDIFAPPRNSRGASSRPGTGATRPRPSGV